jgi:hypothetical protein
MVATAPGSRRVGHSDRRTDRSGCLDLQAQYINDYCTTRAPQPTPANPEALGWRPAYLDGPVTVVCEYDGYPTVTVTDPVPLLGALVLAAGVLAVGIAVFRWARRPPVS